AGISFERLLNEGVQGRRVEQGPPLAGDVPALNQALRFAAGNIGRGGLCGQRLSRIAANIGSAGALEIRPRCATCKENDHCRCDACDKATPCAGNGWPVLLTYPPQPTRCDANAAKVEDRGGPFFKSRFTRRTATE